MYFQNDLPSPGACNDCIAVHKLGEMRLTKGPTANICGDQDDNMHPGALLLSRGRNNGSGGMERVRMCAKFADPPGHGV